MGFLNNFRIYGSPPPPPPRGLYNSLGPPPGSIGCQFSVSRFGRYLQVRGLQGGCKKLQSRGGVGVYPCLSMFVHVCSRLLAFVCVFGSLCLFAFVNVCLHLSTFACNSICLRPPLCRAPFCVPPINGVILSRRWLINIYCRQTYPCYRLGGNFGPEEKYSGPPPNFPANTLPAPRPPPGRHPPPAGIFNKKSPPLSGAASDSLFPSAERKKKK